MTMRAISFLVVLVFSFVLGCSANAQGSSAGPDTTTAPEAATFSPSPDQPSAALRDLLAAACAHDETRFEQFLTARNAESFSRLTPAARVELMKRFVLLDGAGKPALAANSSGRPALRCATPDGAPDLQLGGAELRGDD